MTQILTNTDLEQLNELNELPCLNGEQLPQPEELIDPAEGRR